MSEVHEPAGAAMDPAILRLAGDIAPARAENSQSCSQKNSRYEFFCEQEKRVPCCAAAGESDHSRAQTPSLPTYCVRPVTNTRYAVGSKPGVCQDTWPDSPAAAWYLFDLLHKT
jgi:hypothetical protein